MTIAKETEAIPSIVWRTPRECQLPGGSLCLLSFSVSIKPLANIVASYTCYDGHKEIEKTVH